MQKLKAACICKKVAHFSRSDEIDVYIESCFSIQVVVFVIVNLSVGTQID